MTENVLTIVGFGAQAKAWAHNLHQSSYPFSILLRDNSPNIEQVLKLGYKLCSFSQLSHHQSSHFALLTPDNSHLELVNQICSSKNKNSQVFIYAHGYSVETEKINILHPNHSHLLLAPKSIASEMILSFNERRPIPAVLSFEFSKDIETQKGFISNLCKKLGITIQVKGSFQEETKADLFSEQAILCTLLPYAANHAFNKLIENDISPEVAYLECWYEMKLIANTLLNEGPESFFDLISPNALIGSHHATHNILENGIKKSYDDLYQNIESGQFYNDVKNSDTEQIRKTTIEEWKNSPLQKIHQKMITKLQSKWVTNE